MELDLAYFKATDLHINHNINETSPKENIKFDLISSCTSKSCICRKTSFLLMKNYDEISLQCTKVLQDQETRQSCKWL